MSDLASTPDRRARVCAGRLASSVGVVAVITLLGMAGAVAGCQREPRTPRAVVVAFAEAARAGQSERAYHYLGPRTRERLAERARAAALSGRRGFQPWELIAVGWTPARYEISVVREQSRTIAEAIVEVVAESGPVERVTLVRDAGQWRIELP